MNSKQKSVAILIINKNEEILLMLRDNKESIQYPNTWVTIGGVVEPNETYDEAIKREVLEELEIVLSNFYHFKTYNWPEKDEAVFYTYMELDPGKINLHEGQRIQFWKEKDIFDLTLGFHDKEIFQNFLEKRVLIKKN